MVPAVVIPGIQGHWQWMQPAIDALRATRDVQTFSLNDEDGTRDPFDRWMDDINRAIDRTGAARAVIIGVSFGGLIAARYAATHPDRTAAVVLVSSPSPRMVLGRAEQQLLRRPLALLPLFAVRGLRRLLPEVLSAHDTWRDRVRFLITYGYQVLRRPIAPVQTARWVRSWQAQSRELLADCLRISAPVHVITGDPDLDRVVPVASTHEYLTLIPAATSAVLHRTGHIGLVSRPAAFAAHVNEFINGLDDSRSRRSA